MKRLLPLLFLAQFAFAKEKLTCTKKELARQDCRLTSGHYNIRLTPKTVAWSDGVWHTVDEMPMKGEALEWEKIQFKFLGGWPILQFWLWDKGFSETAVQSLHWYVADAEKRRFTMLGEGVVRKRRLAAPDNRVPVDGVPDTPKYIYDKWESYGLKNGARGSLEWQLNSVHKSIHREAPPAAHKEEKHGI